MNFLSGRDFLLWSRWGHRPPPPISYTLQATTAEKVRLVESILAGRVFETNVIQMPVLKRLFDMYEKTEEDVFVDGLSMGAYDDSCDTYYMDSVNGILDKQRYENLEYLYTVLQRNVTGEVIVPACDKPVEFGCCSTTPNADATFGGCLCKYDGKRNLQREVLQQRREVFSLHYKSDRVIGLEESTQARSLEEEYCRVLQGASEEGEGGGEGGGRLGLGFRLDPDQLDLYCSVKNFAYMPPEGFLVWHTDKYNNDGGVSYRIYISAVDRDGGSFLKYEMPDGRLFEVPDFNGAVRIFTNTHTDQETGERSNLWHTVYSKDAHRLSLGFQIHPAHIAALLDTCTDNCWDDFINLGAEPQGEH
jgi:hypothetical protein